MQRSTYHNEPDPAPYSLNQALDWWLRIQSDDWWRSQMPISKTALASVLGMAIGTMRVLKEPYLQATGILSVLSRQIDHIESREIIFRRREMIDMPHFFHVELPEYIPVIPKISHKNQWTLHAKCLSCLKNQFLPIVIDNKNHVACYRCVPPSQYGVIGAKSMKVSLIHEYIDVNLIKKKPKYKKHKPSRIFIRL